MVMEVTIAVILGEGVDYILFFDLGNDYMNMFILWKFIYFYFMIYLCIFLDLYYNLIKGLFKNVCYMCIVGLIFSYKRVCLIYRIFFILYNLIFI